MVVLSVEAGPVTSYEDGKAFGAVGPYERVDLLVHYAVDPEAEPNRGIVDLAAVERGDDGLVHYHGDATVLRPVDPGLANRFALLDVPNRGHHRTNTLFNLAEPEPVPTGLIPSGDGFLMEQGFTLAWVGWQWDVPRGPARMGIEAPELVGADPGWMQLRLQLPADTTTIPLTDQHVGPLGNHQRIPPAFIDDPEATLYVRDRLSDEPSPLPRTKWRFTENAELTVDGDLQAGRIYELVYRPARRPVAGVGLLAARDLAAFLRSGRADNPAAATVDRVVITGISQNSRFLRHMLSLGLDAAEDGSPALDGVLGIVGGGRRGEFNHSYGQPSVQPTPSFGHLFPFADLPQTDPRTGERAGLLDQTATRDQPPKIMFADSGAEYWRGDASLAHTSVTDGGDVADAPFVRRYLFSSTQHGSGPAVLDDRTIQGSRGANRMNTVDYRPLYRSALMNLVAWIADGTEPPPSAVPRWADGTAATRADVAKALDAIPAMTVPDPEALPVLQPLDLGPDAKLGIGRYPAKPAGDPYPSAVSAVDADGNEVAGLRMPDVSVPVATNTGFNPRHPEIGGPGQVIEYYGSCVPFARTAEERAETGDPRPSVAERYRDIDDYLAKVRAAAQQLVEQRLLLDHDVDLCVEIARDRYLLVTG